MPVGQQVGRGVLTASRLGFLGLIKTVIKHWYLFSIFFFILPTVITSVEISIAEKNPAYPFTELGLTLITADNQIDEDVNMWRKNPEGLFGEKPEEGRINKLKYYWQKILVIWKVIGNIFLISIPFSLAYRYFKWKGKEGTESSIGANMTSALKIGILFMFFMNLLFVMIELIDGTLIMKFAEGLTIYRKVWLVILNTIPFHGVSNLILYLAGF